MFIMKDVQQHIVKKNENSWKLSHTKPVRMAIIKKPRNTKKFWWGCGREEGPLGYCWWEYKLRCNDYGKVWSFLKKIKNKTTYDSMSLFWVFFQKYENANLKRYMHPYSWQLKQPSCENNLGAHQWMNGYKNMWRKTDRYCR